MMNEDVFGMILAGGLMLAEVGGEKIEMAKVL